MINREFANSNPAIYSIDIDGTMEFGMPSGPIHSLLIKQLHEAGHYIIGGSDRSEDFTYAIFNIKCGVRLDGWTGKEVRRLLMYRMRFRDAKNYIHVGDSMNDAYAAKASGYHHMLPQEFIRHAAAGFPQYKAPLPIPPKGSVERPS